MASASALSPGGYVRQGQRGVSPPRSVNVQVAVRCRPLNDRECSAGERAVLRCVPDRREVVCAAPAGPRKGPASTAAAPKKTFTYDHVFGPEASQADVYEGIVEPIVDEVLQGYNCTVFAYGQTGTGKTHTMEGRRDADMTGAEERRLEENAGIIPRAVKQVFDHLRNITDEHSVRVSHLELYNEQLSDLLGPEDVLSDSLRMYEDPHKGTFVQGLEDIVVRSEKEIFDVLDKSAVKRRTAETLMNKYSSRSHSVFSITIHIKESTPEGADLLKVGKLNLVDLAGSENVGRSGAVKGRAREAGNINQSLLTLGRVITALVDRHPHVPYRDSKLTRLLQESLGGRNKTCVIATVTPGSNSVEETASTLDYAYRAKSIKNRPTVNQMIAKHVLLKEYTEEIQKLKRELDANRSKNGVYLPPEEYERLQLNASQQRDAISDLESKNEDFEKKTTALREKLEKTQNALARDQRDLANTKRTLSAVEDDLDTTKKQLGVANQQREENAHLVRRHVSTEKALHDQGTQLQSTLSVCLSDIQALHQRVGVKAELEKENVSSLAKLQETIGRNVEAVRGSLNEHERGQSALFHATGHAVERLSACVDDGLSSIAKQLEDFVRHSAEEDRKDQNISGVLLKSFQENSEESLDMLREKVRERQFAVASTEQRVLELGESIASSLGKSRAAMADMRALVTSYGKQQEAKHESYSEQLRNGLNDLRKDLSNHFERQGAVLRTMQVRNKADLERQKELMRSTQEALVNQVKDSLQTLVRESTAQLEEASLATNATVNSVAEECITMESALFNSTESLRTMSHQFSDSSKMQSSNLQNNIDECDTKFTNIVDVASSDVHSVQKAVSELQTSNVDWQDDVGENLTAIQLGQIRFGEETQKRHNESIEKRESQLLKHQEREANARREVSASVRELKDGMLASLSSEGKKVSQFSVDTKQSLETHIREQVDGHAVLRDTAHDETPISRQWPIPEILTRTPCHSSLITELRRTESLGDVPLEDFGHASYAAEGEQRKDLADLSAAPLNDDSSEPVGAPEENHQSSQEDDIEREHNDEVSADEKKCEDTGTSSLSSTADTIERMEEPSVVLTDTTNRRHRRIRSRRGQGHLGLKKPSGIPPPKSRANRRVGM